MPVILARRRTTRIGANPPAVHAYQQPDDDGVPPVWRAVCGAELAAAEAERVPRFTGAPCTACLMFAFGQQAASSAVEVEPPPRNQWGTYPAYAPISPGGSYALALWGERAVHMVTDRSVRGQLDGRDVVQALCGHLGWGPLQPESVPRGWPICAECRGVAR